MKEKQDNTEYIIEGLFDIMISNIPAYTALKAYDNFQVDAIKDFLELNREFFLNYYKQEIANKKEDGKDED